MALASCEEFVLATDWRGRQVLDAFESTTKVSLWWVDSISKRWPPVVSP
jgi:hypothetical protein